MWFYVFCTYIGNFEFDVNFEFWIDTEMYTHYHLFSTAFQDPYNGPPDGAWLVNQHLGSATYCLAVLSWWLYPGCLLWMSTVSDYRPCNHLALPFDFTNPSWPLCVRLIRERQGCMVATVSYITFNTSTHCMMKYPLKWVPAWTARAHLISTTNDRNMLWRPIYILP